MRSDITHMCLEDAVEALIDYRGKTPKKTTSGVPLITAKVIKNGEILEPNEFIAPENYDSWMVRGLPKVGDVVLTVEAPLGQVAQLTESYVALAQRVVTLRGKEGVLDNTYLKYLLMTPKMQAALDGRSSGSTVKGIKQSELRKVELELPDIGTQRKVASILASLDNKIANNKAMNQTLEKLAQRIFKSWFIDFDPVKANKEGLPFDGLSPEIQALFPSEFEDSELGMIPKGWEVSTIENEVKTVGGATPSTKKEEFWESGHLLWTTPKDLSGLTDKVLFDTSRKITDAGLKKISSGLLPVNTVLMSSRAPVGYLALAKEKMAINQGYIGMICDKNLGSHFMLLWLDFNMESIKRRAGGTTFAEISKKAFRPMPILAPRKVILEKFESQVKPLFERIEANSRQNVSLSNIRDRLLPRLISGQISVGEAAQELAEAV